MVDRGYSFLIDLFIEIYVSSVHVENYPNIDYELFVSLNREMLLICRVIERTFQPDLINYASLGNAIKHFHYHIIPRYESDPNWGDLHGHL